MLSCVCVCVRAGARVRVRVCVIVRSFVGLPCFFVLCDGQSLMFGVCFVQRVCRLKVLIASE